MQREQKQQRKERVKPQLDNKTVKQLLGELYEDREYLEKLLHTEEQSKRKTEKSHQIREIIVDGLNYLEKRTEFWQQQKPMYARKRDSRITAEDTLSKGKLVSISVRRNDLTCNLNSFAKQEHPNARLLIPRTRRTMWCVSWRRLTTLKLVATTRRV